MSVKGAGDRRRGSGRGGGDRSRGPGGSEQCGTPAAGVGRLGWPPDLSQLSGKTVVWATGQDYGFSDPALNSTDQTTLTNFLNGGG
ncbi:MAG: hypothetical protein M3P49_14930, partial [Actinomycetota bacterium]|nr:hypothetical protein [Actinomycetota bacterium]